MATCEYCFVFGTQVVVAEHYTPTCTPGENVWKYYVWHFKQVSSSSSYTLLAVVYSTVSRAQQDWLRYFATAHVHGVLSGSSNPSSSPLPGIACIERISLFSVVQEISLG